MTMHTTFNGYSATLDMDAVSANPAAAIRSAGTHNDETTETDFGAPSLLLRVTGFMAKAVGTVLATVLYATLLTVTFSGAAYYTFLWLMHNDPLALK